MNKTELLNRCANDEETRLILARALDKLDTAQRRSVPAHTQFLSPAQRVAVEHLINASGHPRHLFSGGYGDAERTVCVFLPDWMEEEDWPSGEHPLAALQCTASAGAKLSHRDWLGSIMGLGLTREKIGDLLVEENRQALTEHIYDDATIQPSGIAKPVASLWITQARVSRC